MRSENVVVRSENRHPAVSIRGIACRFGEVTALKEVHLDVRQGEFFSLLGPSGCGKTTLLRIIGGFAEPTSGTLEIDGVDVVGVPPFRRQTNMVFQHGALFPHLTVGQNIAFGLEMRDIARDRIKTKIADVLELVRLGGFGDRQITQLSGGQRQRIAIARALVNEPKVLLLDEPFSALDLQLRLHLQEELKEIQRASGGTFIFVTHDQGEAIAMSDRMAVMQSGEILQIGTPAEVYERPARQFVSGFIGHSNIFPGKVVKVSGGETFAECFGTQLTGWSPQSLRPGDEVSYALRYEKLTLTQGADAGVLTGQVTDARYLGGVVRHRVRVSPELELISETTNSGPSSIFQVGAQVSLSWPKDAATILRD